jgi:hypothetical protein
LCDGLAPALNLEQSIQSLRDFNYQNTKIATYAIELGQTAQKGRLTELYTGSKGLRSSKLELR